MRRRKVFLTGSHGFLGSHLKHVLQSNPSIDVIIHNRQTSPYSNHIALRKQLSSVDTIMHIGGLVKGTDSDLFEANTTSVVNLLEVAPLDVHFIYASSFAVYGTQDKLISENTTVSPRNFYGLSKKLAEEILVAKSNTGKIKATILRFANIYGKNASNSFVWTIHNNILNQREVVINGDGSQSRDFIYVDDAVDACIKALDTQAVKSEIYNICTQKPYSINTVVSLLEAKNKKKAQVRYNESNKEIGYWIGSYRKAKKVLKWAPQVDFELGIKRL